MFWLWVISAASLCCLLYALYGIERVCNPSNDQRRSFREHVAHRSLERHLRRIQPFIYLALVILFLSIALVLIPSSHEFAQLGHSVDQPLASSQFPNSSPRGISPAAQPKATQVIPAYVSWEDLLITWRNVPSPTPFWGLGVFALALAACAMIVHKICR